jgi:hypothetical protein
MASAAARAVAFARAKKKSELLEQAKKLTFINAGQPEHEFIMDQLDSRECVKYIAEILRGYS